MTNVKYFYSHVKAHIVVLKAQEIFLNFLTVMSGLLNMHGFKIKGRKEEKLLNKINSRF